MQRRIRSATACLLVLASLTVTPLAQPDVVLADDAVVTTCDEESFNAALAVGLTNGGGTISFGCSGTIVFSSQKAITSDVTIVGAGVVFDGGNSTRFFQVTSGARLALVGLTLRNGRAGTGGAIQIDGGSVNITASTFSGNTADNGSGGAIYSLGDSLEITASTFSGNSSSSSGGAIRHAEGLATITSSTFSGNDAAGGGGAIYNAAGAVEITASTFGGNGAGGGGGAIYNGGGSVTIAASTFRGNSAVPHPGGVIAQFSGSTSVGSSILAESLSGGNCSFSGTFTSDGYNLSDDSSCGFDSTGDRQGGGVTISLGTLQDNGGPTRTFLPLAGSDAIGAIPEDVCLIYSTSLDQRGVPRPQGDCEIGAVELGPVPVQILTTYNLGPAFQSQPVAVVVVAYGPASAALTYEFDCDGDDDYELSQLDDPRGACIFDEAGSYVAGVRVSDEVTSATSQTTIVVLAPVPSIATLTIDPSDSNEGDEVTLTATFTNPNSSATHTCEIDWGDGLVEDGTVAEQHGEGTCTGNHTYADDDEYPVMVTVCNDDFCDDVAAIHTVHNLPPVIEQITTNSPVPQGQPVTLTVIASDPGILDVLSYSFDCDGDGVFELGPQASNTAECALDPSMAFTSIGVRVADEAGGVTDDVVQVSQFVSVCANRYTRALTAPLASGGCPSGTLALTLPAGNPVTLCVNRYTGELSWSPNRICPLSARAHLVPDDGPLSYCRNRYTGALRYSATGTCAASEVPGVIPG